MHFYALVVTLLACVASGQQCEHFDSNMGATFDLSDLKRYVASTTNEEIRYELALLSLYRMAGSCRN